GTAEPRAQVDHPGPLAGMAIAARGAAGKIFVCETEICDPDRHRAVGGALPAELAVEGVERNARLREKPRQLELALARGEPERAFRFARLQASRQVCETGNAAPGAQGQPGEPAPGGELRLPGQPAGPGEARVEQVALWRELGEQLSQLVGKRQEFRQMRERRQLDQV